MTEYDINEYDNIPFEEQAKYGFLKGFILSLRQIITAPRLFFRKMHINKGYAKPMIFLVIMLTIGGTFNYIYISTGMIQSPAKQVMKALEKDPSLSEQAKTFAGMMSYEPQPFDIIFGLAGNLMLVFSISILWHLIMKSMSVAINGYQATFRVFCYSSAVIVSSLLPVSSGFVNMIIYFWWIYIFYCGISEAHEVSGRLAMRGITISLFVTLIPLMMTAAFIF